LFLLRFFAWVILKSITNRAKPDKLLQFEIIYAVRVNNSNKVFIGRFEKGFFMLMKIFNKGQVVIPSKIRQDLGIAPGDYVDVAIDLPNQKIELRPYHPAGAASVAGSLAKYARRKSFPTRKQAHEALGRGLFHDS
jgi:AbrB family looped-hinge helix DNA binding protein